MKNFNLSDLKFEQLHYEYKKAKGGLPKSFWETYSAFANSSGGYIFLGVEEKENRVYNPINLSKEEVDDLKKEIFNLVHNKEKVSINLLTDDDVEEVLIDNSLALLVTVNRCPNELRPVYIKANIYHGTYRRNHDGDYRCTVEEVNSMIRDSSRKSLDLGILDEHDINSLDLESVNTYRNLFASLHPGHPFLMENNEKFLEFIGAARLNKQGEYKLTKAGLLMFGYSYRISYEFNEYFLDYFEMAQDQKNRWVHRIESTSGEWSGNIFMFFIKTLKALTEGVKKPYKNNGVFREDDNDIIKMIREGLCNTLCNADYYIPGGVVIRKYEDHITFSNPGCLMMDIDSMIKGGNSLPRNKTILKMFNLINVGERSGSGIPLIFNNSKTNKLPNPEIIEEYKPDRTTLIIYTKQTSIKNELTNLELSIIDLLNNNEFLSAKKISELLNKNITTIKLALYNLVDKELISSKGTIKNKVYFIK